MAIGAIGAISPRWWPLVPSAAIGGDWCPLVANSGSVTAEFWVVVFPVAPTFIIVTSGRIDHPRATKLPTDSTKWNGAIRGGSGGGGGGRAEQLNGRLAIGVRSARAIIGASADCFCRNGADVSFSVV